jgi:hypothetical protein
MPFVETEERTFSEMAQLLKMVLEKSWNLKQIKIVCSQSYHLKQFWNLNFLFYQLAFEQIFDMNKKQKL